jgi:4-amino-4-deoxy-L-arabinose transferase-like glycosyltransferase
MKERIFKALSNPNISYWKDLLMITLILGPILFGFLNLRPFAVPDEGRYVEIPREMVTTGDYITPHLNGLKYFEKPPLMYWIQSFFIKVFDLKEWAMRLPLALLGLFGCFITYVTGRFLFNRSIGFLAATILGSSLLYIILAQLITLDMGVSFFLTGCLSSFLIAINKQDNQRRFFMYIAAAFAALSVLAKGLIGLALPGLIVLVWLTLTNNWKLLTQIYLPSSIVLFFLIATPWHVLVSFKNPEFFDFYFINEHFTRFLTTVHRRYQPFWFFIPIIIAGFLPWTPFFLKAFYTNFKAGKKNQNILFLLLWILIPFVFFSVSNSKLIPYILPIFPAMAIITGIYIEQCIKEQKSIKFEVFLYSSICLAILLGGFYGIQRIDINLFIKLKPYIIALYFIFGFSAVIPPVLRIWKGNFWALFSILLSGLSIIIVANFASVHANKISMKPLVTKFKKIMPENTKVITYSTYYHDLPVYLNRLITIYNWTNELEFGHKAEPHKKERLTYNHNDVINAWQSNDYVCLFTKLDIYKNDLIKEKWFTPMILGQHDNQILICNRVPEEALQKSSVPR